MSNVETLQLTVPLHKSLNEILQVLGEPEIIAASALRRYLLDTCLQRIEQAKRQINMYEQLYDSDYDTFNHRMGTDKAFLETTNYDYPTWEADAIEWLYRIEEVQTWQERSEKILRESWPWPEQS
ncbi:hypothetical protein ACFLXQ_09380 [Chloroflexota bacterium]